MILASAAVVVAATACAAEAGPPVLTWYINPDDGGQAELAAQCTDEAGGDYRISTSLLPRDAPGQREQLARRLAAGDTGIDSAAFMVNWPFVWAATQAAVEEGALDQELLDIGWALYPAVSEDAPARPPYGGISLGVSAFSEHVEESLDAIQCIVQPENQAFYFVNDGNPPSHPDAYDDPEVQEAFPMADVIQNSLEQAAPRPQTPYYNEVSEGIQTTWHPPASVQPDTSPAAATTLITEVLRGERLL